MYAYIHVCTYIYTPRPPGRLHDHDPRDLHGHESPDREGTEHTQPTKNNTISPHQTTENQTDSEQAPTNTSTEAARERERERGTGGVGEREEEGEGVRVRGRQTCLRDVGTERRGRRRRCHQQTTAGVRLSTPTKLEVSQHNSTRKLNPNACAQKEGPDGSRGSWGLESEGPVGR